MPTRDQIQRIAAGLHGQSPPPSIEQQLYSKYPILEAHGIEVGEGTPAGPHDRRKIEFYHPDEDQSPRKGVPYTEIYDKSMPNMVDTVYTDALHYLHKVDPKMHEYREWLRNNMTAEQKALSHKRYRDYTTPGSPHYNPDRPETRSYEDWFEVSDLDQLLGGYLSGVWPAEMYTDEQIQMLEEMRQYSMQKKR